MAIGEDMVPALSRGEKGSQSPLFLLSTSRLIRASHGRLYNSICILRSMGQSILTSRLGDIWSEGGVQCYVAQVLAPQITCPQPHVVLLSISDTGCHAPRTHRPLPLQPDGKPSVATSVGLTSYSEICASINTDCS